MTVRLLVPSDRPDWLRMRCALWPECAADRHQAEMEQIVSAERGGVVLVAVQPDDSLCGFIEISIRRDHVPNAFANPIPYVEGWYAAPDCRGQRIGRSLMQRAEEWARNQGFRELASDALIENEGSIRAHFALGFREASREVHFIKSLG